MSKCGKQVTIESVWAGERHYSCTEHAEQLAVLGEAMGVPTSPRFVLSDKLCQNKVTDEVKS